MSKDKPKCAVCGKAADHIIKNKLPGATLSVFVCGPESMQLYNAIKWKLVADGNWIPRVLTLEELPAI
jgi:hypothetical protein